MDYFEATVAKVLEEKGYWVRQNVPVKLTKEVKRILNNPSMPRCEIDIVAYKPAARELRLYEVKSYLDSPGVQPNGLRQTTREGNRYKLLTLPDLQREVKTALLEQYREVGLLPREDVDVKMGLAAGHVQERYQREVEEIAKQNGWDYLGPHEIADAVRGLADLGYENTPFTLTAKILTRYPPKASDGT